MVIKVSQTEGRLGASPGGATCPTPRGSVGIIFDVDRRTPPKKTSDLEFIPANPVSAPGDTNLEVVSYIVPGRRLYLHAAEFVFIRGRGCWVLDISRVYTHHLQPQRTGGKTARAACELVVRTIPPTNTCVDRTMPD